ncbi:unnamed protein product [Diabrotica balteata]|uniref:Uncharacterized protein n=1 Tax=Diabrotica balteata TaxID=107213 RepID=A0A9N9SXB8_DIABA|nr:unnamed protein product [Diabrotica balteata]
MDKDQRNLSTDDSVKVQNVTSEVKSHVQLSVPSWSSAATKSSEKSKFDNFFDESAKRDMQVILICKKKLY